MARTLKVVGLGGAIRPGSSSELALRWVAGALGDCCEVDLFVGRDLLFPMFDPAGAACPEAGRLVEAVRGCDAIILSSPVYHGGPSGLVKNALDHLQPLAGDARPYLSGRPVLCMSAGGGLQGAVQTATALRDVVQALRGWVVPMIVPVNSSARPFDEDGRCADERLERTMRAAIADLLTFARAMTTDALPAAA